MLLLSLIALVTGLFAEEEEFIITTYYPSPYGSYNELSTNKFAVGDADGDGKVTDADQPNLTGDIRLKPQAGNPASWSAGKEGEIAYSSTKDTLYVNNGSKWVAQGGSAGNALYLACPWGNDRNHGGGHGWGDQCGADGLSCCTPASCPSGWTSVATFAEIVSVACGNNDCLWNNFPYYYGNLVSAGHTVRVCIKD